ncbi:MAG: glycosyltransferase, partial [Muribaculaceae bacterium]|nr:glycosyltransferase [Muribaculaceae bacterium]
VAVGRLDEQKGFDILIKAWESVARIHPDWKLDIYGTGRDKEMLQDMIDKSGLTDKVTLCGVSDDMPKVYASGSIFVLSSRFEGFGLVLLEAMTCGVPCVSFDCPEGPSEIITDGRDGILVPFRGLSDSQRAEVLAENICRMIENRDMRLRMSEKAIAKAATFSRDVIIDRWIELFNDITKK